MADSIDLVVPNIAEFNLRNPALRFDPLLEQGYAAVGTKLADQSVFWSAGPRVLVLPPGLDPRWFADVHRALHGEPPPVVFPASRTGLLIKDLLRDGDALRSLRTLLAGHRRVRIRSWGATPAIYDLVAAVESWGSEVELDVPPEDAYWASLYLESKLSCVDLSGQVPGFRVPAGVTVSNWAELRGALDAVLAASPRAIVKSLHGVGGDGSVIAKADAADRDAFWRAAHREPFFRSFPLIVQRYVEHAPGIGCPAVDLLVTGDGIEMLTVSAMTVVGNRFRGVHVGSGALPPEEAERVTRLGTAVAAAARDLGYRGWLCLDCIVGHDGELYVTEINARRSGAMHAIALLDRLDTGRTLVAASNDALPVRRGAEAGTYERDVAPVFERLWQDGVQAFPTSVRGLGQARQEIAVVALAATAGQAAGIVDAIGAALGRRDDRHELRV